MPDNNKPTGLGRMLGLGLLATAYFSVLFRVTPDIVDEGIFVSGAMRVLNGDLPYRDFAEVSFPGSIYWLVLLFKMFGTSSWVARASLVLVSVGIVLAIDWISRAKFCGEHDFLPALFYMFTAQPLWPAISQHWDSHLPGLLAAGFFLSRLSGNGTGRLSLAGFFAGLCSLCQQQKGAIILLTMIALLMVERWRAKGGAGSLPTGILALCLPYGLVLALLFAWFHSQGALDHFIDSTILFPLRNYSGVNESAYGYWLIERHIPSNLKFAGLLPDVVAPVFLFLFLLPYYLYLFLPLLVIGSGAILVCKRGCPKDSDVAGILETAVLGLGFFAAEMHRRTLFNILWASPLLVVAFFLLWQKAWEKRRSWNRRFLSVVFISCCLVGMQHLLVAAGCNVTQETRHGRIILPREDRILKTMIRHTTDGETAFLYPFSSNYYFLANLRNPTRFGFLIHGYHTREQFQETIDRLEKYKVRTVFWDTEIDEAQLKIWLPGFRPPTGQQKILEAWIEANYSQIDLVEGTRVLRRKS